jgi:hypothetical protein
MSDRTVTIDLKAGQREFLDEVVRQYALPDVAKAVRCLVNYAREHPDARAAMFDEVRCLDC